MTTTSTPAPVFFISHGAPTFAIEPGRLGPQLQALGAQLSGVRAVLEAAGVKNILTKSMGSSNHIAVVHATLAGLQKLRLAEDVAKVRKIV